MPDKALQLSWEVILNVFFVRYSHRGGPDGEELAHKMLLDAQIKNFRAYSKPPPDFSLCDDLDDMDSDEDYEEPEAVETTEPPDRQRQADDSDDSDDPMDDCPADGDFVPEYIPEDIPEYSQTPSQPAQRATPKPKKSRQLEHPVEEMPYIWAQHIGVFFFTEANPKIQRSAADVVHDYCQMRDLPKRDFEAPAFQSALEESGLLDKLHEVCRPGNLLETSHEDVEMSFRFHSWKSSYAEIICKWTPPTISPEEYEQRQVKPDPQYEFSFEDAQELFLFIANHPRMHPWNATPFAAYFLVSLDSFLFYSETWLEPSLRELKYPRIEGWNPTKVYRAIMQTPVLMNAEAPESTVFLQRLDPKLSVVIYETWAYRVFFRRAKNEILRPRPPSLPEASSTPTSQKVRLVTPSICTAYIQWTEIERQG
ncbi:hypothetical protein DFH06DRAFT_261485 [Mycena polygramma]|nr:hypothetical protein DFH06DRAFT_261485 [Mycena polygramma]